MALAQVATTGLLDLASVTVTGTITNVQFWDPVSAKYVAASLTLAKGQATYIGHQELFSTLLRLIWRHRQAP